MSGQPEPAPPSRDEHAGWEEILHGNVDWVYALMLAKVGAAPDAEELTTEVFMTALEPSPIGAAPIGVEPSQIPALLRETARSVLARYWLSRVGREITVIDAEPHGSSSATPVAAVADLLAELPEPYRRILELRFLQGLSIQDTAARLGVGVPEAEARQRLALRSAARPGSGGSL
ncbi:RNA polymerase sigma factor [Nocardia cerradoensis]|uniref:RNA polymerase sigma factor n=1 Tax=Nocardia cerradoensis TaxID=85688 RepID=UPI0002EB8F2C|nr:RNA polymerase sigma factor [Nocardia cerradoensis]NKY45442.1 RNA polymerase sigma factor [Nocardia cerradoensis]